LPALQQWRAAHGGQAPNNFKEKQEFKETLRDGIRMNAEKEGIPLDEENFEEAIMAANTALNQPEARPFVPPPPHYFNSNALLLTGPPFHDEYPVFFALQIPENVSRIFGMAGPLNESSSNFWIMVNALKTFVENFGVLPLRGAVPDMVSDSDIYISLQMVYTAKAKEDFTAISAIVQESLGSLGRDPASISQFELKTFCKNAGFIEVIRTRSLAEERANGDAAVDAGGCATFEGWMLECEQEQLWYVLLRAVEVFKAANGHYPGEHDEELLEDTLKLKECTSNLLESWEWSRGQTISDENISKMCRFGAAKLHTVSSFLGGTAAQGASLGFSVLVIV
jgi:amyloid beta precursor protein binding protein 1